MPTPIEQPIITGDYSTGLVDDTAVSSLLLPKNAVRKAINVLFNRPRGAISQRYGYTKIATTPSAQTVVGLYNYRNSGGSNVLLEVIDTVLYRLNTGTWTSTATGFTSGQKTRFLTYLDTVAVMNGVDSVRTSTDGITWTTTGGALNTTNFPVCKFGCVLNTRLFVAGVSSSPDTVYGSSLESSGAISWTSGNKSFKVGALDGTGQITGMAGNSRVILIFKNRSLYRYDDTELQLIGFVGTPSHESIVTDDNGITYFFGTGSSNTGIYLTDGGRPVRISRMIQKYIDAIDPAFYANICAYTNGSEVEWSIGSITIGDNTYTNASIVYSISDRTWTVYSRADRFRVFAPYIDSNGALTVVGGDTDGDVHTMNSGTTDNGSLIFSEVELAPLVFTTRGRIKTVASVIPFVEHYQGLTLSLSVDESDFFEIGDMVDNQNMNISTNTKGHVFVYKLSAVNSGTPWIFLGMEHPIGTVFDEGYSI